MLASLSSLIPQPTAARAIPIHGKNFIVADSDLWVSGSVFKSDGIYTNHLCAQPASDSPAHTLPNDALSDVVVAGPNRTNVGSVYDSFIDADCVFSSARWGLIANNTIMNGGACHWFDQAQQVVFENNSCTGNNPMSMGNNIDT